MTTGGNIYIVDDQEGMREWLRTVLESAEYAVETYSSGVEFLESEQNESCGCLLLDVRMPDVNGFDVQSQLTAKGSRLPVIIMTGHADIPIAVKAMKAGSFDFLEKPFTPDTLFEVVERALMQSQEMQNKESAVDAASDLVARLTARERDVFE